MKYPCEVIRDMVPLYIDQVCSEETAKVVEGHFKECEGCSKYYQKMKEAEEAELVVLNEDQLSSSFKKMKKKMLRKVMIILSNIILYFISLVMVVTVLGSAYIGYIQKYENKMYHDIQSFADSQGEMWDISGIWPMKITDEMTIKKFNMMTYDDDATAYTGYLVAAYEDEAYKIERKRLEAYPSTEYVGNLGAKKITAYDVLAMKAHDLDPNLATRQNGFTYAMTNGSNEIIYVVVVAPHHIRGNYDKIIPSQYLPEGIHIEDKPFYTSRRRVVEFSIVLLLSMLMWSIGLRTLKNQKRKGSKELYSIMIALFIMASSLLVLSVVIAIF